MPTKLFDFIQKNLFIGAVAFGLPFLTLLWAVARMCSATTLQWALGIIAICVLAGAWMADQVLNPLTIPAAAPATKPTRRRPSKWKKARKTLWKGVTATFRWVFPPRAAVVAPATPAEPRKVPWGKIFKAIGRGFFAIGRGIGKTIRALGYGIAVAVVWAFGLMGTALAHLVASVVVFVVLACAFSFAFWAGLKLPGLATTDVRLTWLGEKLPPKMVDTVSVWYTSLSTLLPTWWAQAWAGDKPSIFALAIVVVVGIVLATVIWNSFQAHRSWLMPVVGVIVAFTLFGWYALVIVLAFWSFYGAATVGDKKTVAPVALLGLWPLFTLLGWLATMLPGAGEPTFWSALWNMAATVPVAFGDAAQTQVWVIGCAATAVVGALVLIGGSLWAGSVLARKEKPTIA